MVIKYFNKCKELQNDIDKGKHTINISYMPQGFILGVTMTILGIISLLLFYYLYNNPNILKKTKVVIDKDASASL